MIAETNAKAFYNGELADRIDTFMREHGGLLRKDDLEAYTPEWVEPVSTHYRDYDVWEIPTLPVGSGEKPAFWK